MEPEVAFDVGTIKWWPIMYTDALSLVTQIGAGEHDRYLAELRRMEQGHGDRLAVLQAVDARSRSLQDGG